MSRIFLSLHPYYESGAIFGRKQANIGFINALFRKNPFDLYHFFVDNPNELIEAWQNTPEALALFERGLLHAFPRTHLERRLKTIPYSVCHFSDPMTEFSAMCHVRNLLAPKIFPITSVTHTISYTSHAKSTLGHIWQGTTPRDGIGCTSHTGKSIMQSWYEHARNARNIPDDWHEPQLKVIPLGVPEPDLSNNEDLRKTMRHHLKIAPETVLILLCGRVSIMDKMDVRPLFTALRRISATHPNLSYSFCIAGSLDDDDPIKTELINLAKAWDIPFNLITTPDHNQKKQLFAAADIFVSPVDNIQETFGLALVEAAQVGLPIIASNWDGYKDIVLNGETGFLIPTIAPTNTPTLDCVATVLFEKIHQLFRSQQTAMHVPALEEALFKLISDAKLRKRMGDLARERAAKLYNFENVIDEWINFWQELENTPISDEDEKNFRNATHPYALNYGKAFSTYSSHELAPDILLQCTELGLACIEKRKPFNNHALAAVNLVESLIHKLIRFTTTTCTVAELINHAKANSWGNRLSEEVLFSHIYWLIKQDLIQCEFNKKR